LKDVCPRDFVAEFGINVDALKPLPKGGTLRGLCHGQRIRFARLRFGSPERRSLDHMALRASLEIYKTPRKLTVSINPLPQFQQFSALLTGAVL